MFYREKGIDHDMEKDVDRGKSVQDLPGPVFRHNEVPIDILFHKK